MESVDERLAKYAGVIERAGRELGWNDFYPEDARAAARAVIALADAEVADAVRLPSRSPQERSDHYAEQMLVHCRDGASIPEAAIAVADAEAGRG